MNDVPASTLTRVPTKRAGTEYTLPVDLVAKLQAQVQRLEEQIAAGKHSSTPAA